MNHTHCSEILLKIFASGKTRLRDSFAMIVNHHVFKESETPESQTATPEHQSLYSLNDLLNIEAATYHFAEKWIEENADGAGVDPPRGELTPSDDFEAISLWLEWTAIGSIGGIETQASWFASRSTMQRLALITIHDMHIALLGEAATKILSERQQQKSAAPQSEKSSSDE